MKQLIRKIEPNFSLYRDDENGIAWIEDGYTGIEISIHPTVQAYGTVEGMKELGYWGINDRTVKSHGCIYNIDKVSMPLLNRSSLHELVQIVLNECKCQACQEKNAPIKKRLYQKLVTWIDGEENKTIYPVLEEDDGLWHRMIFVVSYPVDNVSFGIEITVKVIRVFTMDETEIILSEDFSKDYPFKYVNSIPDAIKDVCEVLDRVR